MEGLETLGWSDALEECWDTVMFGAARAGRRDIAQRLMRLREPHGFTEADLDFTYRLLLVWDDPARCLQLIEECARQTLQTEDIQKLLGLAYGVSLSPFSGLGILLYRGLFPLVTADQATVSFEQLLRARDRLNLPPDDPISDLVDQRLAEHKDDAKDASAMREAQHKLDAKVQEVQQLKNSLARLQKEITRRETKPPPPPPPTRPAQPLPAPAPTAPVAPADDQALRELRRKVATLRDALTERHTERNDLRRELQKAQTELATIRQQAAPPADPHTADSHDAEEDLLLPQETEPSQPVRLIEFPRDFPETLRHVPPSVARGTLAVLGRLAAGEPAAFVGAIRLKACPSILRRRVGIDFRLLFRLLPDRVQVVDLIPRQDLERRIKTLV